MNGSEIEVPKTDLQIAAVYVPPATGEDTRVFEEARAAFKETDVAYFTSDRAAEVGRDAARRLGLA